MTTKQEEHNVYISAYWTTYRKMREGLQHQLITAIRDVMPTIKVVQTEWELESNDEGGYYENLVAIELQLAGGIRINYDWDGCEEFASLAFSDTPETFYNDLDEALPRFIELGLVTEGYNEPISFLFGLVNDLADEFYKECGSTFRI